MSSARMAGAIAGGLLAGIGISALLLNGERKSGKPSELVLLGRAVAREQGFQTPSDATLPNTVEQAVVQAGHLLLSAAAGAAYAGAVHDDAPVIGSGVGFGLAFYAAMHWVAGPLTKVKNPEWQSDPKTIAVHTINHVAFGLITAFTARWAQRRDRVSLSFLPWRRVGRRLT
jgi:hypothetical protein